MTESSLVDVWPEQESTGNEASLSHAQRHIARCIRYAQEAPRDTYERLINITGVYHTIEKSGQPVSFFLSPEVDAFLRELEKELLIEQASEIWTRVKDVLPCKKYFMAKREFGLGMLDNLERCIQEIGIDRDQVLDLIGTNAEEVSRYYREISEIQDNVVTLHL